MVEVVCFDEVAVGVGCDGEAEGYFYFFFGVEMRVGGAGVGQVLVHLAEIGIFSAYERDVVFADFIEPEYEFLVLLFFVIHAICCRL